MEPAWREEAQPARGFPRFVCSLTAARGARLSEHHAPAALLAWLMFPRPPSKPYIMEY